MSICIILVYSLIHITSLPSFQKNENFNQEDLEYMRRKHYEGEVEEQVMINKENAVLNVTAKDNIINTTTNNEETIIEEDNTELLAILKQVEEINKINLPKRYQKTIVVLGMFFFFFFKTN